MLPVSVSTTPTGGGHSEEFAPITADYFTKDGIKISVGDCALFKPPKDSPPFVGIIYRLIVSKDDSLSLSVSWLYRPADVKLVKGLLLEAAPNEVFYSFHRAEIPAASLLHPCKVAFLGKGVEFPSGLSSLVCRRVYDTETKCLRWLSDKDYVKERQKEVDQLLDKTSIEMYAGAQPGGRSPKALNGPQVKPSSDSAPNSSSSYHSQAKGKKRDLVVQGSDSVKRERTCKADDADSGQLRPDQTLKLEIAKITDRGGLTDFEGVDKLVQLMQPDSSMKKLDLACRIILANVIAVTDRFDCLTRFVQLRGLPVLDDWLQQVHKGKLGDNNSPKEGDKSVDEFLLSLLRALDKLPVNLHALQTCNIGKSVNHLRTHRNSEIQKKARSLVDTWKKRVEAEMNMIDAKSGSNRGGSWPTKSVNSEISNVVGRRNGEPTESGVLNSSAQCGASKIPSAKLSSSDKLSVGSPGTAKQSPSVTASEVASAKDLSSVALAGAGSSDAPLTTIKEDKSNSSSPSQNNSQSCSSEYGKTISCREEARSSTAVSIGVNKTSGGITRSRKSNNGHNGTAIQGIQKEISLGKMSSEHRSLSSEKSSPARLTSERTPDASHVDNGNNRRLIVRLPNTARSPACSASGGSAEDVSATSSKGSPLMQVEEPVGHDGKVKGKVGTFHRNGAPNVNMDTNQHKDGLPVSEDANMSSGGFNCDEQIRVGECSDKLTETPKDTRSPSRISAKSGKSYEALFSSMNALVDSCVKVSEANVTTSVGDDIGMNLLASVAAGEMSRSNISPSGSSGRKSSLPEEPCSGSGKRLRPTDEGRDQSEDHHKELSNGGAIVGHGSSNNSSLINPSAKCVDVHVEKKLSIDSKTALLRSEEKNVVCGATLETCNGPAPISNDKLPEPIQQDSAAMSPENVKKKVNAAGDEVDQFQEPRKPTHTQAGDVNASSLKLEQGTESSRVTLEVKPKEELPSFSSSSRGDEEEKTVKKLSSMHGKTEDTELPCLPPSTVASRGPKAANDGEENLLLRAKQREDHRLGLSSVTVQPVGGNSHGNPEKKVVHSSYCSGSPNKTTTLHVQDSKQLIKSSGHKSDVEEESACIPDISTVPVSGADLTVKVDFDLNEGPISLAEGRPPSVTIASAAKGPFVPPENPSRLKGELGWRGSAATSAFRPAEPRKNLDMPLCTVSVPLVGNSASKQSRPLLDFDLNIPDQRAMEEVAPQKSVAACSETRHSEHTGGGLNLDLNISDDSPEIGHFSVSSIRMEMPKRPGGSSLYGAESNTSRDFDLNNGPGPDEGGNEFTPHAKNGIHFSTSVPPVRMNNMELGNFAWISPGVSYSPLAMPPILPGRGDQNYPTHPAASSQRIMLPPGNTSFSPELYRGPVLSSSPAVGYTPNIPFQYPGLFPFETNFPLSSNSYSGVSTPFTDSSSGGPHCLPAIPSQLMRPTGMGSTHYTRPFVMSLPGSTSNVPESKKWGNQGLDLNAGPGVTELDRREERLPSALRQLPLAASQALPDEQLKMYQQMAGGMVKRKEPDGGFDGDRINYKHPPWQ
ncbi:BAH and TFIIS domain-containing protein [Heracleum sosnowskyi]|uniref:BAH and TFIIS domain-containing protein n=1 Tax=Heracleum sosnowskyi TaxID=360622 RepID=A0AAD8JJQ1_9APIA|nr:BAH and TFIIS domain-containing protein [Heracleum sosnowskyi]